MKISIIGYSGSGKSTLCSLLSDYHNINKLHLDSVQFSDNWQVRTKEEKELMVNEFLNKNKEWIIDGNYSNLFSKQRFQDSDKIIFMNFNRLNCLFRIIKRYLKYRNTTREDLGGDCKEKLDYEFIKWVLIDGRTKIKKNRYKNICVNYQNKILIINNQHEFDEYLNKMV
jgi:adenylate kinase family enzyme